MENTITHTWHATTLQVADADTANHDMRKKKKKRAQNKTYIVGE